VGSRVIRMDDKSHTYQPSAWDNTRAVKSSFQAQLSAQPKNSASPQ